MNGPTVQPMANGKRSPGSPQPGAGLGRECWRRHACAALRSITGPGTAVFRLAGRIHARHAWFTGRPQRLWAQPDGGMGRGASRVLRWHRRNLDGQGDEAGSVGASAHEPFPSRMGALHDGRLVLHVGAGRSDVEHDVGPDAEPHVEPHVEPDERPMAATVAFARTGAQLRASSPPSSASKNDAAAASEPAAAAIRPRKPSARWELSRWDAQTGRHDLAQPGPSASALDGDKPPTTDVSGQHDAPTRVPVERPSAVPGGPVETLQAALYPTAHLRVASSSGWAYPGSGPARADVSPGGRLLGSRPTDTAAQIGHIGQIGQIGELAPTWTTHAGPRWMPAPHRIRLTGNPVPTPGVPAAPGAAVGWPGRQVLAAEATIDPTTAFAHVVTAGRTAGHEVEQGVDPAISAHTYRLTPAHVTAAAASTVRAPGVESPPAPAAASDAGHHVRQSLSLYQYQNQSQFQTETQTQTQTLNMRTSHAETATQPLLHWRDLPRRTVKSRLSTHLHIPGDRPAGAGASSMAVNEVVASWNRQPSGQGRQGQNALDTHVNVDVPGPLHTPGPSLLKPGTSSVSTLEHPRSRSSPAAARTASNPAAQPIPASVIRLIPGATSAQLPSVAEARRHPSGADDDVDARPAHAGVDVDVDVITHARPANANVDLIARKPTAHDQTAPMDLRAALVTPAAGRSGPRNAAEPRPLAAALRLRQSRHEGAVPAGHAVAWNAIASDGAFDTDTMTPHRHPVHHEAHDIIPVGPDPDPDTAPPGRPRSWPGDGSAPQPGLLPRADARWPDLDELTERVWESVMDRLLLEQERRGSGVWLWTN